jgi:hypothetical protein
MSGLRSLRYYGGVGWQSRLAPLLFIYYAVPGRHILSSVSWILTSVFYGRIIQAEPKNSDPREAGQAWPIEDPAMRGRTRFFRTK